MNKNRGFTLVEVMIVIAVIAIAIVLAIPSFRDVIVRKAVGGAAEAAYSQLQVARSQALKRSKPILVDFYTGDSGARWAIGITDKMTGCNAQSTTVLSCTISDYNNDGDLTDATDNQLMRIESSDYKNITMSQFNAFPNTAGPGSCTTTSAKQACFDFVRGLARPGAYEFASGNYKLRVEVSLLGHVNICDSGAKSIPGYRAC